MIYFLFLNISLDFLNFFPVLTKLTNTSRQLPISLIMSSLISEVTPPTPNVPNATSPSTPATFVDSQHSFPYTTSKLSMEFLEKWNVLPDFITLKYKYSGESNSDEEILRDLFR